MVRNASFDPVVVQPDMAAENIAELFRRAGNESYKLDWKRQFPTDRLGRLKLAKHVIAMANTVGGYIGFGVGNDGTLLGISEDEMRQIDDSDVRNLIQSVVAVPIGLFVHKSVSFVSKQFAIITVLPLEERIAVISAPGDYKSREGKSEQYLRLGEVYVRHGSQSACWNQDDVDFITTRLHASARERWRSEFAADYLAVTNIQSGPPALTEHAYDLSPEEYRRLSLDLLRSRNG